MSEPSRDLYAVLDRAAAGPISNPPVEEMLRRGRRRRRARRSAGVVLSAALTAVVVVVAFTVVGGGSPTPRPQQRHSQSPVASPSGASARQIAAGSWHTIPQPPFKDCGASLLSTGADALLLAGETGNGCQPGAALFDPQTDAWRKLATPPRALWSDYWQATWDGPAAVVLSASGAVAEFSVSTNRWTILPAAPVSLANGVLAAGSGRIVVAVLGTSRAAVASFDGTAWRTLPPLPLLPPGARAPAFSNGPGPLSATPALWVDGRAIWAFDVASIRNRSGFRISHHLQRLGPDGWTDEPVAKPLPLDVDSITRFGRRLLVLGGDCPPGVGCPEDGPILTLANRDFTTARTLPQSALGFDGLGTALPAGQAIVGIDDDTSGGGPDSIVKRGAVVAFDPKTSRWYTAPRPPRIGFFGVDAWTSSGLVELGRVSRGCHCSRSETGGLLLRPAH
jgi:hypothetical protein